MNRTRHPLGRPIGWTPGRPAKRRRTVGFDAAPCVDEVAAPDAPTDAEPLESATTGVAQGIRKK